ncbi:MAG: AAA family ATPase [Deltaproteobacteria bacterium]|nr:AAA family ATPase [Deltaproteobacteria bacterium]
MHHASEIRLTDEQRAVVESTEDIMAVTAFAGTGKTSTLRAFAASRPRERILYVAFNRSLADESKVAFASCRNVEVRTIHSLAWSQVGRRYQGGLGELKAFDLVPFLGLKKFSPNDRPYELARIAQEVLHEWMISSKRTLPEFFKERKRWVSSKLAGHKATNGALAKIVGRIWEDMVAGKFTMPHNGYLKLFQLDNGGRLGWYDRILVDEAQDLNDCMISLLLGNDSKKIFVGDPYQQIYAFNGAVDALGKARAEGAAPYYLTQSFRCPDDVAEKANQYLKLLGSEKTFRGLPKPRPANRSCQKLVVARTNAGLFDHISKNLGETKYFYNGGFEGYRFDIILDIVNLIVDRPRLVNDSFLKKFKNISEVEDYAIDANDTVTTTRIKIARRHMEKAFQIYSDMQRTRAAEKDADWTATTAHKIKGQEFQNVLLLDDYSSLEDVVRQARRLKLAGKKAGKASGQDNCLVSLEEFRLLYVAMTRSRMALEAPRSYLIQDALINEFKDLVSEGFIVTTDDVFK